MGREFFDEYCSPELLALITGYVCPKYQMKSLNEFGIPFLHPKGNRKFPLVLRSDGDKILKGEKVQPITQTKERSDGYSDAAAQSAALPLSLQTSGFGRHRLAV